MNIKKLYFWLVSLISIVAIAISLGIILSNLWKLLLISNQEYLANNSWYDDTCKNKAREKICGIAIYNKTNSLYEEYQKCILNLDLNPKYQKILNQCQQQEKEKILLRRYYNLKISLIWSFSSLVVFLVLFVFHYSKFRKLD